jgi:hypothetical protein
MLKLYAQSGHPASTTVPAAGANKKKALNTEGLSAVFSLAAENCF